MAVAVFKSRPDQVNSAIISNGEQMDKANNISILHSFCRAYTKTTNKTLVVSRRQSSNQSTNEKIK